MLAMAGASLPVVVGVKVVTKDVENDHPAEPNYPHKQHPHNDLCHGWSPFINRSAISAHHVRRVSIEGSHGRVRSSRSPDECL